MVEPETRTIDTDLPGASVNIPAEAVEKINSVDDFIAATNIVKIEDQTTYDQVNEIRKTISQREKELEEKRKTITRPIDDSKAKVMELFRIPIEKLAKLKKGLLRMQGDYQEKQRRIQQEQQRLRDAEAAKERERLEEAARKKRVEEERERKAAEDARRKAAEEKDRGKRAEFEAEAKRRDAKADRAADASDSKQSVANEVRAPKAAPKVEKGGVFQVTTYDVEVRDMAEFVQWALASKQLAMLEVNTSLLKKQAQASKGELTWPGIKVNKSVDTRGRTR